jgi:hypothetical protein
MASIVGVTLNQPNSLNDMDTAVERFAVLYESQAAVGADAPFQDIAQPSVKRTQETAPRLDITAQVDGRGTLLKATLAKEVIAADGTAEVVTKQTTVLLPDIDAMAATRGLADVLENSSELNTRPTSQDALANRLYEELQVLIDDLNNLFDDLDLALFAPLPADPGGLPNLDQFTFTDAYYERFWQLTWASWSGERPYDMQTMVELGMRSSAVTTLGVDFTRRIVDSVAPNAGD